MAATDTLRTARTLTDAGVPDRQADATARAIDEAVSDARDDLLTRVATREDLAQMRDQLTWRLLGGLGALLALFRLSEWLAP